MIRSSHARGLGLAFHGRYVGGEFSPSDFFGLIARRLCWRGLEWVRIHRRHGRRLENRATRFNLRRLSLCLELAQLATQSFDFSLKGFHFLRAMKRSGFHKLVVRRFGG